jgi:hypothetical protein
MLLCLAGLKTPINAQSTITVLTTVHGFPYFLTLAADHPLSCDLDLFPMGRSIWGGWGAGGNGMLFYIQWQPTITVLAIKSGLQIKVVQLATWSAPIWNS